MQRERRTEFAASPIREPAHAGAAYPEDPAELRETMVRYMTDAPVASAGWRPARHRRAAREPRRRLGIVPRRLRRAAAGASRQDLRHPGDLALRRARDVSASPARISRRRWARRAPTAPLVDWLANRGGAAVAMEDYCFSFEHTVEFQVVFLQHVLGPDVKILPVLCGPFARSIYRGRQPGGRRRREALLRRARRTARARGRQPGLGARRGHGAHGRALRRPLRRRRRTKAA